MRLFFCFVFTASFLLCFSQTEKSKKFPTSNETRQNENKELSQKGFFLVPSVSLGFSSGGFRTSINPNFGYAFSKWIDAGLSTRIGYTKQSNEFGYDYHTTTIGIGAFTRIYPVKYGFIQIQPEINYFKVKMYQNGGLDSKYTLNSPSLLLGLGFTPSRNYKNNFPFISLMFDILKDKNSPYLNSSGQIKPNIRIGFNIGLFNKKRNL